MSNHKIRMECYLEGVRRARRFCKVNNIAEPVFMIYNEMMAGYGGSARKDKRQAIEFERRVMPYVELVGANTGLYRDGVIFVNIDVTALPVAVPRIRNWSWPCWKTDRTAVGVVAHELGHYCEDILTKRYSALFVRQLGEDWRALLRTRAGRKCVSGYEPVPSEAAAETMRLYILNPDLLRKAIPARYDFMQRLWKSSERRAWRVVLGAAHDAYIQAAVNWIG